MASRLAIGRASGGSRLNSFRLILPFLDLPSNTTTGEHISRLECSTRQRQCPESRDEYLQGRGHEQDREFKQVRVPCNSASSWYGCDGAIAHAARWRTPRESFQGFLHPLAVGRGNLGVSRPVLNSCRPSYSSTVHPLSLSWSREYSAAKVSGSDVKVGNIIEKKGKMFEVVKAQHTQQGRGGATIQVELRDVHSGFKSTEKLRTAESIEVVFVDAKPFSYLYAEGDEAHLMDPETYEQLSLPVRFFGEGGSLLKEGMQVTVKYFNGEPLMAQMPSRVTAKVVEAEPHVKGNTATPSTKKVVLEGGLKVQVPPFVVEGDEVVVDTSNLSYVTRAQILACQVARMVSTKE